MAKWSPPCRRPCCLRRHSSLLIATAADCTASRASLLTGRFPWRLEEGFQLWGLLPQKYVVYPDLLEAAGYFIGKTFKGWGPGSVEASGRTRNPAGPAFNRHTCTPLTSCMSTNDYTANFADFLSKARVRPILLLVWRKEPTAPRGGLRRRHGKLSQAEVPPICRYPEVRSDLLDYALEIERFDRDLGAMLKILEERGELDNTIVIVTGDNGLPFPVLKQISTKMAVMFPSPCLPEPYTTKPYITDFISFLDLAYLRQLG